MTLKPSFKFSSTIHGRIWQTALDATHGIWVLEIREPDTQRITYELIYLKEAERVELPEISEADWWTVVLKLYFPVLILERYNDPQNPTDKDLILYHVKKKKVVAELKQFQFEEVKDGLLYGCNPKQQQEKKQHQLSQYGVKSSADSSPTHFPVYFAAGSENQALVDEFLQTESSGLGCEYFESKNYIIISYYVRSGRKYARKLLVLKDGEVLYHQVQDPELDGFASGAFFVYENLLVFIKNGNQINGIEL